MICDSCTTCPPAPLLPLPLCRPLSSSGRRCDGVGRLPPSPGVCETPVPRASGWPPSSTRSSTADRWRWRRRTVQTSRRSEFPGTHRRAGHPARMASLPPATWGVNNLNLAFTISAVSNETEDYMKSRKIILKTYDLFRKCNKYTTGNVPFIFCNHLSK